MKIKHLLIIILIYFFGVTAWFALGANAGYRSGAFSSSLDHQVQALWGAPIYQQAPIFKIKMPGSEQERIILPMSQRLDIDIQLDQRRKGLIWYPTYMVDFKADYIINNSDSVKQKVRIHFPLPSEQATYDQFSVYIDDNKQEININPSEGMRAILAVNPGEQHKFSVHYRTRGLREWHYQLAGSSGRVNQLDMVVTTDFTNIDFPEGSLSPMNKQETEKGMQLHWQADDLITVQDVAITMPEKLNPGPLAARMSFFAPICLLFFFVLIGAISILRRINIHPMHYTFVTAGFFAFNLLFAYLVDVINIHLAFFVASSASVSLVVLYLRSALGSNFPWQYAALGQLFYLVLFSYSFFMQGITGLTVTIGAVLTLAILMYMTAKIDWSQVFKKQQKLVRSEG